MNRMGIGFMSGPSRYGPLTTRWMRNAMTPIRIERLIMLLRVITDGPLVRGVEWEGV